ncbi:hypothetical protein LAZ67_7001838 [Cordylochernes scorpioides]|uniref:Uncharacterized protein n=1 Tax=Cordylochernes scorpioides TaxID=51811 RepID=A0ABY6KN15_9ARAC|nr:hypothetical protein LAZ67_7001838 [Cordylochernes scorpioides]
MELLYYPSHPILLTLLSTALPFTLKLKRRRFDSMPEIKEDTKNILKSLKDEDFQRCFDIWKKRWNKLSTVVDADEILVLKNGEILERGSKDGRQI